MFDFRYVDTRIGFWQLLLTQFSGYRIPLAICKHMQPFCVVVYGIISELRDIKRLYNK